MTLRETSRLWEFPDKFVGRDDEIFATRELVGRDDSLRVAHVLSRKAVARVFVPLVDSLFANLPVNNASVGEERRKARTVFNLPFSVKVGTSPHTILFLNLQLVLLARDEL